jgi:hypothetical protein
MDSKSNWQEASKLLLNWQKTSKNILNWKEKNCFFSFLIVL